MRSAAVSTGFDASDAIADPRTMLVFTQILGHLENADKEGDAMFKRSVAATFVLSQV